MSNPGSYLKDLILLDHNLESFDVFFKMLIETNKNYNLTAITDQTEVYIKHFLDSIELLRHYQLNGKLVDVGSGAGFPGIPLRIAAEFSLTMLEPTQKRCLFLNSVIEKLELNDCEVLAERAEDHRRRNYYDYATSRAVTNLSALIELTIPLLKVGGLMFAYKGSNFQTEIDSVANTLKELNAKVVNTHIYTLPENCGTHAIIVIKKIGPTKDIYPRPYSRIKNLPLN